MNKQKRKLTDDEITGAIAHGKLKPELSQLREMPAEEAKQVADGVERVRNSYEGSGALAGLSADDEAGLVRVVQGLSMVSFGVSGRVQKGLGLAIGKLWETIVKEPSVSTEVEPRGIGLRQFAFPFEMVIENIIRNGAIIAAKSTKPPYEYHWPRDAALVLRTLTDLAQISGNQEIEGIVDKVTDFTVKVQDSDGKWSQRYTPDGDGSLAGAQLWADPQLDGVANSMIALSRYVRHATTDRNLNLEDYRVRNAAFAMIRGCGYLLRQANKPSWGLWEERNGYHFYTTLAIRRSFKEFTGLYDEMGLGKLKDVAKVTGLSDVHSENVESWKPLRDAVKDYVRTRKLDNIPEESIDASNETELLASMYRFAKAETRLLEEAIEGYKGAAGAEQKKALEDSIGRELRDDESAYIISHHKPLSDENIPNTANIGSASVGAVLHFGGVEYDSPQLMLNVMLLDEIFGRAYPVNDGRNANLWGRYNSDPYDGVEFSGGNPWYICSFWGVQYYYNLAAKYLDDGKVDIRGSIQSRFLERVTEETVPTGVIKMNDERFASIVDALIAEGDRRFENVRDFIPEDGGMSEQMDKNTGEPRGAQHLTWSYDEFLQTIRDRAMVSKLRKNLKKEASD